MKKILIISSCYLGAATANGICAKNIARQLRLDGHDVSVLCYEQEGIAEKGVYTVPYPTDPIRKSFFAKGFALLGSFITPSVNKKLTNDYVASALKLCAEKNIDTVVAMFFPFESVAILKSVKKQFPKIKTVIYELDSVGDGVFIGSKYQALANNAIRRWCDRQYCYADQVILMRTHEEYWKRTFGKKHGSKLSIADIPVLVERPLPKVEKNSEAPLRFLYGGLIQEAYRSPNYLLKIFEEYRRYNEAELHFFSKGGSVLALTKELFHFLIKTTMIKHIESSDYLSV